MCDGWAVRLVNSADGRGEELPRGKVCSLVAGLDFSLLLESRSQVGIRPDKIDRQPDRQTDRQAKISPAVIQNPAVWLD